MPKKIPEISKIAIQMYISTYNPPILVVSIENPQNRTAEEILKHLNIACLHADCHCNPSLLKLMMSSCPAFSHRNSRALHFSTLDLNK